MTVKRTVEEIKARMVREKDTFFGFQFGDLLEWLPFAEAQPHLKKGVTAEQWVEVQKTGDPLDSVRDYLPFAWEKANDCRGLSAGRSVEHMKAWLWLAGFDVDDDFDERYTRYGKPCLVVASEVAGFDWRKEDNGEWVNEEDGPALSAPERQELIDSAVAFAAKLKGSQP